MPSDAPIKPLVAWAGDDFTGAAASMEVLAFSGLSAILFLGVPTPERLAAARGVQCIGIATLARSQSPDWMQAHLPGIFRALDACGAEIAHYKICSTLDSSPAVGSIGKAAELARDIFGTACIPVVTAAPRMGRYQAFGNLFCEFGARVHRLDRHPVMSRHPVTPMTESDVAVHLSQQTGLAVGNLDLRTLKDAAAAAAVLDRSGGLCTIDMLGEDDEPRVGRVLWDRRGSSRFVIGSQGVEYALTAHFREIGIIGDTEPPRPLPAVDQLIAVSGSVSPTTADQIGWARKNGFRPVRLEAGDLCGPDAGAAISRAVDDAKAALSAGTSPLILTAEGPDDPAVDRLRSCGVDTATANLAIGRGLGIAMRRLLIETGCRRVVVSGGDTSGQVCTELGIFALEAAAPTIPGAAICRARSDDALDGLEIALKGGQMGSQDYFGWVRDGGGLRP